VTGQPTSQQPGVPGSRLVDLVAVMDTLRIKCPWDARQTHESLTPHLLEETYEAVDALASGDPAAVREELGDVLLQVLFHARVAQDRTDGTGYTIDDVADGIAAKLIRRHPHVFGDVEVTGAAEVKKNWDAIKAAERAAAAGGPVSALDGVPMHQPALSLATQLLRRATRAGAPAELTDPDTGSAAEAGPAAAGPAAAGAAAAGAADAEAAAARGADAGSAEAARPSRAAASELGRRLFALAAQAQAAGIDPELELRAAAHGYAGRVRAWEEGRHAGVPPPEAHQPSE
jgi:XTP/dITP diphosphohydrolase